MKQSSSSAIMDRVFGRAWAAIGMVHVGALPGTPRSSRSVDEIIATARDEAVMLAKAGFHAIIVENMHDTPYVHGVQGPEIVASMTLAVRAVIDAVPRLSVGVQILSGGNREALAVAHATGARFIRCENFVFAHVADEGLLDRAEAGALLRYRRAINADSIAVFCDIKKKHASHAITSDLSIGDVAEGAAFFGADGLVVTGSATGKPTDPADVTGAKVSGLPVLVGSGAAPGQIPSLRHACDGVIVGSAIKRDGLWSNGVDESRARAFMDAVRAAGVA